MFPTIKINFITKLPLSKRDYHAAIAAFSFCLRAVIFENGGAVLPLPRLLYEGDFQRNLQLNLRICLLTRLLSRKCFQTFRKEVPKCGVGGVVIYREPRK